MATFSGESTTDDVIAGVDLSNKTAVITGASTGLGLETAATLAGAGARIVMLARDAGRLQDACGQLLQRVPGAQLDSVVIDLADLDSVRAAAAEVADIAPAIDLLINNAGIMACPQGKTAQGFELQLGTNHLGHFLLTLLLAPCLAPAARVVCLSSGAHRRSGMRFDDPNFEQGDYDKWVAYGQSKTANALFALGLNQRLAPRNAMAFSVHPGAIATELGRHLNEADMVALGTEIDAAGIVFKTIPQGAATSVWAATSPDLADAGGCYLEDCSVAVPGADSGFGGVQDWATDPAAAEQLWQLSEQWAGISLA